MKKIISDFLNVPIDYYVQVRYSGVEAIIDTIGGVQVNIPFKMEYDDPYADPPLHIYFEPGTQTLSGEEAVKYLRWRKNNGEDGRGDLYRIQRQQDFIMKAFRKSVGLRLPIVVKTTMNYVRTDMPIQNALYYAAKAADIDFEKIEFHQIPGEPGSNGSGYYIHHPQEMEEMFEQIYSK
jgi:anionic cell wall polymer biosynthesis LytR-Cps2A-Psr (LCP) family protein